MAIKDNNGDLHSEENGHYIRKSASELRKELMQEIPNKNLPPTKGKSITQEEFFGEEFKGVKSAAAIDKLLQEKRGHVKNAFERPEIGGIDLVWGDENGGLLHTIQKRDKLYASGKGTITGLQMAKKIPVIIEKGEFGQDEKGRLNIDYENYRVGLTAAFYNNKVNWIVTAMEKWK